MIIPPGATSVSITIQIVDDTGLAVTGLAAATFPTTYYSRAGETLPAAISLSDLAAQNSAYSSGGVKELAGGYYRLDVPDAAFTTASRVRIIGEASGKHIIYPVIAVQYVQSDVRQLLGTAWATPATAGLTDVNVKQISTDPTAADNAEAFFDGTGYAGTNNVIPTVTTVSSQVSADVVSISGDITAADNLEAILDGTGGVTLVASAFTLTTPITANATQISGDATAADNAESFFDGTGYAGTNNVIPTVTNLTNLPAITAGWLTTAGIAANAINASKLDPDVTTELQAGLALSTQVDALEADTTSLLSRLSEARMAELDAANLPADIDQIKADLPQRITKNTALSNFEFLMVDSSDHVSGKTGLTVTATRSIDGAAFGACANAVAEVANGIYKIDLAAADLNGNVVTLKFTATGADTRFITIATQPT